MFSQEYVGALAIVLVGVLKLFGVEIGTETVSTVIMAVIAVWVAVRRYQKGDITPLGARK